MAALSLSSRHFELHESSSSSASSSAASSSAASSAVSQSLSPSQEIATEITRRRRPDRQRQRTHQKTATSRTTGTTLPILPSVLMSLLGLVCLLAVACHAQDTPTSSSSSSTSSNGKSRQAQTYALPAFSMLLRVQVDADDDDDIYLDLEIFQETLERVTQLHLTDVFQQFDDYEALEEERFSEIKLSTKVRQDILDEPAIASSSSSTQKHVPLHAAYSGVVTYSFPATKMPVSGQVEAAVQQVLEYALKGDNYLLLFRRYLSTGILGAIEDIQDIRIGTQQIVWLEDTERDKAEDSTTTATTTTNNAAKSSSNQKELNAITIVAIVIFLTLSCLLMLFGATVFLIMRDRAKQEQTLQGETLAGIGMGDGSDNSGGNATAAAVANKHGDSNDLPAWKRAVLPVLRKAIMVRRYWKKQLRKQRKARRKQRRNNHNSNTATTDTESGDTNDGSPTPLSSEVVEDNDDEYFDDGLNDEDIYYDDNLTDEEAANQWLDNWTQSITSIPVRKIDGRQNCNANSPNRRSKKKKVSRMPMAPHPAKRQSQQNFLGCIAEEDSGMGTMEEEEEDDVEIEDMDTPTTLSPRSASKLGRIQELASVIMEEDYPRLTPSSAITTASNTTAEYAYGTSARRKKQLDQHVNEPPLPLESTEDLDHDNDDRIEDVDLS